MYKLIILKEAREDLASIQKYIILMRYYGDVLKIIRVVEGHRDIGATFQKGT